MVKNTALYELKGVNPLIYLLDDDEKLSIYASNRFDANCRWTVPEYDEQDGWVNNIVTFNNRKRLSNVLEDVDDYLRYYWDEKSSF